MATVYDPNISSITMESGHWNYAVPLEGEEKRPTAGYKSAATSNDTSRTQRQPLSNQVNGSGSLRSRQQVQPTPETNTETGSLMDSYRASSEKLREASREQGQRVRKKGSYGVDTTLDEAYYVDQDPNSKWIHRDKLAQIESREMEEMRLRLGTRTSRSGSKSKKSLKSITSGDFGDKAPEELQDDEVAARDLKRQRTTSPTQGEEEFNENIVGQTSPGQSTASIHARRPSTSRIPVPNASPPSTAPRARSGSSGSQNLLDTSGKSNNLAGPGLKTPEPTTPINEPTSPSSPTSKGENQGTPSSSARKTSKNGKAIPGQRPGTSSGQGKESPRPGTSGGTPRPTTARPEGDPPWLATMYKPDPRLPPDQQMLPTHARKLAEEQAERERAAAEQTKQSEFVLMDNEEPQKEEYPEPHTGQTDVEQYERMRDLELTQDYVNQSQEAYAQPSNGMVSQHQTVEPQKATYPQEPINYEDGEWPLKTPSLKNTSPETQHLESPKHFESPKPEHGAFTNGRSATPVEHGKYNLMPTIQNSKEMQDRLSQRSRTSNTHSGSYVVSQPTRVLDPPEDEQDEKKKKKGCGGCCAVM